MTRVTVSAEDILNYLRGMGTPISGPCRVAWFDGGVTVSWDEHLEEYDSEGALISDYSLEEDSDGTGNRS